MARLLDAGQGLHSLRTGSGGRLVLCCGCSCCCNATCHPLNHQIHVIDYTRLCVDLGRVSRIARGKQRQRRLVVGNAGAQGRAVVAVCKCACIARMLPPAPSAD